MKKFVFILCALAPLSAFAVTTFDTASVLSVTPQVEQVRTPGRCHTVTMTEQPQQVASSGLGGSILGGVVGGLLGNQVGGGSGRSVATAAGAIAGVLVGGNMDRGGAMGQPTTTTRQECEQDAFYSRTTGYMVNYDYRGQRGTVITPMDPGATLQMRVTAEPVVR